MGTLRYDHVNVRWDIVAAGSEALHACLHSVLQIDCKQTADRLQKNSRQTADKLSADCRQIAD